MQAYVEGDAEAFERLFQSLAPSLRAFFLRSVREAHVADDLVQTTFLELHRGRRRWRRDERVRPWIFGIAGHVRVDWLRKQRRVVADPVGAEELPAPEPDASAGLVRREQAERVHAAVESLPESQRLVVHLHRFEGLGFAEIAEVLGISEGAAKLRAFRAYEELRKRLGDLVAEDSR